MSYGLNPYGSGSFGGGRDSGAPGGGVISDPSRPDLPGYRWSTQTAGGPYGSTSYGGGGLIARPVSGGLVVEPDPGLGVVRLSAWWAGATFLRLLRVVGDVRTPVRDAYPAAATVATRRNLATNPSGETSTAGYLAGTNTTLSRVVADTLAGLAHLRLRATASGSVSVTVPVLLPTDSPFGVSFNVKLSGAPSGALTVTATWQDSLGAQLTPSTATIPSGSLPTYVNRWDRTGVFTLAPPIPASSSAPVVAQGALSISVAGLAANATVDLDAVLVERGTGTSPVFFDGNSPYGSWTGTVNESPSALASPVSILDREAPLDVPFSYELSAPGDPFYVIRSEPVTLPASAGGGSASARSWLVHPSQPGGPFRCKVTAAPELTRSTRRGLHAVLGRAEPIAVATSVRSSPAGSVTVLTETLPERDRLVEMLADNQPLLLRAPAELGFGPGWWISVGDTVERATTHFAGPNHVGETIRLHELPFVVVSAPALAGAA